MWQAEKALPTRRLHEANNQRRQDEAARIPVDGSVARQQQSVLRWVRHQQLLRTDGRPLCEQVSTN